MAYATVQDVQDRMIKTMTEDEQRICETLLDDAAALIDSYNSTASDDLKKTVSCRIVSRAMQSASMVDIPMGATSGSMSGLGYSQSWTLSSGSVGELYLGRTEKRMLGLSGSIGSRSPVEDWEVKLP